VPYRQRQVYRAGLRRARLAKQKAPDNVGPEQRLPPRLPNTYDWQKLSPEERGRFDQIMAVYAADIACMDRAVGRLVDTLSRQGVLDDTLILLMADNGGHAESGPDGILEGGPAGGPNSKVFGGTNWATLENTPFQWFKHFTKEGGISSPLIAHWPNGLDPKLEGSLVREPSHLIDVMPTLVEVTGATYPRTFAGHEIIPEQGRSFAPAFAGKPLHRDRPLFWEHEGNRAIRDGDWKLVSRYHEAWELYDLSRDRSEQDDLASKYPDRVLAMAQAWTAWAAASDVDPWDDAFDTGLTGHRQNWGGSETPRMPQASDRVESA
jgi:arylsulfatase